MDRFRTLEPVRLHGTAGTTNGGGSGAGGAPAKPQQIGRLSAPIHARIATYLAIPDVPAYARTCKALNKIVGELGQGQGDNRGWERQVGVAEESSISFWEARWRALGVDEEGSSVSGATGTGSRDGPGGMEMVLDALEARLRGEAGASQARQPAALLVPDDGDLGGVGMMDGGGIDDFGDFADADTDAPKGGQMDEFVGAFGALSTTAPRTPKFVAFSSSNMNGAGSSSTNTSKPDQPSYKTKYMRAHRLLKPLLPALSEPPHAILSALFPPLPASSSSLIGLGISSMATHTSSGEPSLALQSSILRLLSRWLSPLVQPVRRWEPLRASLRGAMDRFEAALLAAFDGADTRGDESGMREAAYAAWAVYDADGDAASSSISEDIDVFGGDLGGRLGMGGGSGGWELARAWADKREVFYEAQRFRAEENVTEKGDLDFSPMDAFLSYVLGALREHGSRAVRVFPPQAGVLGMFAERVGGEVIGEYISALLSKAQSIPSSSTSKANSGSAATLDSEPFLRATAACFREAWRAVEVLKEICGGTMSVEGCEDVVYRMFEPHMDEYLDEEVEFAKRRFDSICRAWDAQTGQLDVNGNSTNSRSNTTRVPAIPGNTQHAQQPRFLSTTDPSNPQALKRSVLASFTNALLLPVTLVPRAVVGGTRAVGAGIGAGIVGIGVGMGAAGNAAAQGLGMLNPSKWGGTQGASSSGNGGGAYKTDFESEDAIFEVGDDDDDDAATMNGSSRDRSSIASGSTLGASTTTSGSNHKPTGSGPSLALASASASASADVPAALDHLLSLDTALSLIHASRESLKRAETFAAYPAPMGHRVRDALAELFVLLLVALEGRHVGPGFDAAKRAMEGYRPSTDLATAGFTDGNGGEGKVDEPTGGLGGEVAPLVGFFELVHVGDTIASMVDVYYDKEIAPHIDRTDFLNAAVRQKKAFENALDDAVAAGLNSGTDVLMGEVDHLIQVLTPARAYYPPERADGGAMDIGETRATRAALGCLRRHCELVKGSTGKEVLEVFYQEVGFRLIAILQKHIKRQIISLQGGFQLIADLNAYHAFITSLRVSAVTTEFAHLKMLAHVFVVADAPDLAQIVRDVSRYGGAYRPEDIYEFVQRRADWKAIERTVDKAMYNLSFKEDCVVA